MSFLHSSIIPGRQPPIRKSVMQIGAVSSVVDSNETLVDIDGKAKRISFADLIDSLGLVSETGDFATAAQGDLADGALQRTGGQMNGNITFNQDGLYLVDGRDVSADGDKLDGIESGATADQTASEIKTLYESNSDTNEFSDAEQTKLAGIESGATADQSDAEIETAYNAQVGVVSQGDAEAGTATVAERWTPERVKQAIAALETGGAASLPRSYMAGLTLSLGTDATNDIDITVGEARNADNDGDLVLAAAAGKQIDVSWASGGTPGTPTGGLSSSLTLSDGTWYHVHLILVSGTVEVGFDTSIAAANLFADHSATEYRRIGSVRRGIATNVPFRSREVEGGGLEVLFDDPPEDVNDTTGTTAEETRVLSVPLGVGALVLLNVSAAAAAANQAIYVRQPVVDNEATSRTAAPLASHMIRATGATNVTCGGYVAVRTNTSSQVKTRCEVSYQKVVIATLGWVDSRR